MEQVSTEFEEIVGQLGEVNYRKYEEKLLINAKNNLPYQRQSLKKISPLSNLKKKSAIIISGGPSLHRKQSIKQILESNYEGCIIAVDASYAACLREGLIPDFVLSLDPHPTRMVRWFGDPNLEENSKNDDYFKRQDLDVEFRKRTEKNNQFNIELINKYGHLTKGIIASSIPPNVLNRLLEAKIDLYWWNPLVDDPYSEKSLTRRLYDINQLPALNTGGNVGTSAWVFAVDTLNIPKIALVGMDLGYYADTPYQMTQAYPQLVEFNGSVDNIEKYFIDYTFPLTQEKFYTDVTYYWYRRNFLQLYKRSRNLTINCTEGGVLFDDNLPCATLKEFLNG